MARPTKCRAVEGVPGVVYFKPAGIPLRMIEDVELPVEEYEAIRLRDMAGLEQEDCAVQMGVSRPTFQRILNRARRHIAEAITQGKALKICGGNYSLKEESGMEGGDLPQCRIQGHAGPGRGCGRRRQSSNISNIHQDGEISADKDRAE